MTHESRNSSIVMLGNSLTSGGDWEELFPGRGMINQGISGDNTFGILARLPAIIAMQPQKLFLLVGINDISQNTPLPLIFDNCHRILQQLTKESPGTRVFVQSLLPTNNALGRFLGIHNKGSQIRKLNELLRKLTHEQKLDFIDLYPHFLDSAKQLDKRYTSDGLHLLSEGYMLWAECIRTYVEQ